MITHTSLNFFSVFIFLGVIQGLILSWFFITKGMKGQLSNLFQGLLIFTLSCSMFEEFLNETGYIVQVLWLSDFAEPFNFAFAPLFFLFIRSSLKLKIRKTDLLHFLVFVFWIGMMYFHYSQPEEFKYNSYIHSKHPEWLYLEVAQPYSADPLGLRSQIPILLVIHFSIYMFFAIRLLVKESQKHGINLFRTNDILFVSLRNTTLHFIAIIIIFIIVKLNFPGDVGDYFISSYITFMLFSTTFRIMKTSGYFEQASSFMEFPLGKYKKSTLTEETKEEIMNKIKEQMEDNKYFLSNMASLEKLSSEIRMSKHHVSQVINEKMDMNFFELLAHYRVEEAKKILDADPENKVTVEDLADRVGYNSRSSFNNAFKKITGLTPSQYRSSR
ncbi:MAG: helix-turn-helix domain-containing protein [Bacteroidales bacterium]